MNKKIKAVLFDLDGVLVDMPDGHFEALNKALKLFGANINNREHYDFFNGLPTTKKIEELVKQGRLPEGLKDFINKIKQKYTKEIIPKYCPPNYSKLLLLKELKSNGFKLGCCSNSTKETLHIMLKSANLFDFFDIIIGNDEVKYPKPDPEMYIKAMSMLNLNPKECIIVEDSPHGITSAQKSGANVYIVKEIDDVSLSLFKSILK